MLYKQIAHFIKNSNHYAVQAFLVPLRQSGPGSWWCAADILDVSDLKIRECINVSYSETLSPTVVWESLKLDCKEILSNTMVYRKKQYNCELHGLCKSL